MTHLSTSQPGNSNHGPSRLASMICSVFLALTLLLASGPFPASIGAKDQQRHGSHTASPRDEGKANERGDSRQKPGQGTSAKKGKPAAGKGKRQGKKGAKGKKKDHHREKGKSKHKKHQKHKGQQSKGGNKGGNKDHGKNEKQTSKNKKAQDRHKDGGKKGPKSAHHRDHGGNGKRKDRSKAAQKPDERTATAMTASADGDVESIATGTDDATTVAEAESKPEAEAERQSAAERSQTEDLLDGPVRSDEPSPDREDANTGAADSTEVTGAREPNADSDAGPETTSARDEEPMAADPPQRDEGDDPEPVERQDEATTAPVTIPEESPGKTADPAPEIEPVAAPTANPARISTQDVDLTMTAIERPMPEPPPASIEALPVMPTTPVEPAAIPQEDPAVNSSGERDQPVAPIATAAPVAVEMPDPPPASLATEPPSPSETPLPEPTLPVAPEPSPEAVSTATPTPESSVETEDDATATPMPTMTATPMPTVEPTAEPLPTPLATPVTSSDAKPASKRAKSAHRKRAESSRSAASEATTATPSEPTATATATATPATPRATRSVSPTPEPTVAPPTPTPEPAMVEVPRVETPPARVEGRPADMPEAPPVQPAEALVATSPKPSPRSARKARLNSPALPSVVPEAMAITPSDTPIVPQTPVPVPEAPPVGVDVVTIEAVTSNHDVIPGEPVQYRFQLTNTADVPLTVLPAAINSHDGWAGVVLRGDGGTIPSGEMTLGPRRSALVVVAVTVPADARVGDRNTVSLSLSLADPPAEPENLTEPELEADRKLEDEHPVAIGLHNGVRSDGFYY